ncbi:MAG: hypothetical protein KF856_09725 [Cyclobacteriaceae bacterium]|nr:hypothetical protein [Cyclobacteriaceae bacterium]
MRYFNLFPLLFLVAFDSNGQKLSLGVFAEYNLLHVYTRTQISTKYLIFNSQSSFDGFRIGANGQWNLSKGYWSFEAGYFQNQSSFTFVNLTPDEDPQLAPVWFSLENIYSNRRIDINFNRGITLYRKKIYAELGILGCYWMKDELAGEPDAYFEASESLRRTKILFRFADSYKDLSASLRVKLSYTFGPLIIYVHSEKSITPISEQLEYNGVNYLSNQKYMTYSIGVKYLVLNRAQ